MEMLSPEFVAQPIARASRDESTRIGGSTIKCVVPDSCHTSLLDVALRTERVLFVGCLWGEVRDTFHTIMYVIVFISDDYTLLL